MDALNLKLCSKRYRKVAKDGKVYCPDGTAHLVDEGAASQSIDLYEQHHRIVPISTDVFYV